MVLTDHYIIKVEAQDEAGQVLATTSFTDSIVPSNEVAINMFGFVLSGDYSLVSGQPTGTGELKNGNVGAYPEGACIPVEIEVKNKDSSAGDIIVSPVYDFFDAVIGIDHLEEITTGLSGNPRSSADNLNDFSYPGSDLTSVTSFANSSGSTTAVITGPFSGNGDGTSATTGSDAQRHYNATLSNVGAGVTVYMIFCARLGPDASQYSGGASMSVRSAQGGNENVPIPVNKLLELPSITLTKVVDSGSATPDQWTFNVSPSINGTSSYPIPSSQSSVTVNNVSPDGNYIITESGPAGYSFASGSGTSCTFNGSTATATVAAGDPAQNATCIFHNAQDTGTIIVEKQTLPDGASGSFTFTGDAAGTISDNGQIVVNNLVPGTYTSTETNPSPTFALTNISCDDGSSTTPSTGDVGTRTATFELDPGETVKCIFTNSLQTGHIIVVKDANPNDPQDFTFTNNFGNGNPANFDLDDDSDNTLSNSRDSVVITGIYSVSETVPSGWDQSSAICDDGSLVNAINVSLGETVTCTFTNTKRGHLVVQKTTLPGGDQTQFQIEATGSGTISGGGAGSVTDSTDKDYEVTPGTYFVTETVPDGWSKTGDTCQNVVVGAGQTVTCTITNTKLGTIIVEKQTNPDGDQQSFNFSGDATGSISDNGQIVIDQLLPGTYSSTETVPSGWDLTDISCDDSQSQTVSSGSLQNKTVTFEVDPGETVKCTFTNTKKGHLIVQKTTNPSGDPTVFPIEATGSGTITGGVAGTITDSTDKDYEVTPGTYSVAETVPAGWDKTGDTCQNVAVVAGETKTCLITNTKRGHVIIVKNAVPNNAQDFTFDNNFGNGNPATFQLDDDSGASGANNTFSNTRDSEVLPESYSVSEEAVAGWKQSSATCSDGSAVNNISVSPGETVTCTFTNKKLGSIVLIKNTIGGNGTFAFVMTGQSLPASAQLTTTSGTASQTFNDIDPENTYSTNETVPTGWNLTDVACANENGVSKDNDSFTINNGGTVTCTFTNTKLGTIIVEKQTDPNGDEEEFEFSGNAAGSISDGQQITVPNLSPGTYTSTETVPQGWDLTDITCDDNDSAGDLQTDTATFNVSAGEVVKCTFTNTKRGHLIVEKTTIPGGELTLFPIIASGSGTITGGGSGVISDASDKFYEVTSGTYSVEETVPEGWDKTGDTCQNVIVAAGETKTCLITNTKRGEIIVEKQTNPDESEQTFEFDPSYGDNFSLTDGQTDNSGLLVPDIYSVSEITPEGWDLTATCDDQSDPSSIGLDPGEIVTCTFTNTQRGTISGTKQEVNADSSIVGTLSGWVIQLFSGDTLVAETTTDGDGNFTFNNIVQGVYTLVEQLISGWIQIFAPSSVELEPGGSLIDNNFGNFQNGQITGMKFEDLDGDGEKDEGEPGLEDWTIFIDETGDETTTDGNGNYVFSDLGPGSYTVCEEEQEGWQRTKPAQSNCETVNITDSDQTTVVDFGNFELVTITAEKFNDLNGDHTFDTGEPKLQGWTIKLDQDGTSNPPSCSGGTIDGEFCEKSTNSSGNVSFPNLGPGTYILSEVLQGGWVQTRPNESFGGEGAQADGTYILTLSSGDNPPERQFGNQGQGTITVNKDVDSDGDGDIDTTGATDWTYDIDETGNFQTGSTQDVAAGTYTISEDLKDGYHFVSLICNNQDGEPFEPSESSITVNAGDNIVCTFTNTFVPPVLTITKTNNKLGIDVPPGSDVLYTLTVTLEGSPLTGVILTDLLPNGFVYQGGSWTASSSVRGDLKALGTTTEPTYASPGLWQLGDMVAGEIITLTLIADIVSNIDLGLYRDLAWAKGTGVSSTEVLANENSGIFVGTEVNVTASPGGPVYDVQRTEEREGEVLGASIVLPQTGADTRWIMLAVLLFGFGVTSFAAGLKLRRKYE